MIQWLHFNKPHWKHFIWRVLLYLEHEYILLHLKSRFRVWQVLSVFTVNIACHDSPPSESPEALQCESQKWAGRSIRLSRNTKTAAWLLHAGLRVAQVWLMISLSWTLSEYSEHCSQHCVASAMWPLKCAIIHNLVMVWKSGSVWGPFL